MKVEKRATPFRDGPDTSYGPDPGIQTYSACQAHFEDPSVSTGLSVSGRYARGQLAARGAVAKLHYGA